MSEKVRSYTQGIEPASMQAFKLHEDHQQCAHEYSSYNALQGIP